MTRCNAILGAFLAGVIVTACGGSEPPPKDPSTDAAATMPADPAATPDPPADPQAPPSTPAPDAPATK